MKNKYFSKIKGQISSKLPFLRNLDFCTPNLVSDGSFGFLSKGDNYFWEKIPKTDHSSNIRIIFPCLVLGKSSKIALFHTVFWIPRYSADLGPFLTQNRKVRSKMNQKKCGSHVVNDTFFSLWEYWSWVSARAQTMPPLGEKQLSPLGVSKRSKTPSNTLLEYISHKYHAVLGHPGILRGKNMVDSYTI